MDTTTRKTEALALLAKIDPNDRDYLGQDKFCFHLNLWTAERAGYTIKDAIGGWEVAEPGDDRFEFVSFLTDAIPSYTHSVDVCLLLPLPDGCWWLMTSRAPDTRCSAAIVLERHRQHGQNVTAGDAQMLVDNAARRLTADARGGIHRRNWSIYSSCSNVYIDIFRL